jgi:hypothetical protein
MISWLVTDCKVLPNTMIEEIELYDDDFALSDDLSHDDFAISDDLPEVRNEVELAFHVADGEAVLLASGTVSVFLKFWALNCGLSYLNIEKKIRTISLIG